MFEPTVTGTDVDGPTVTGTDVDGPTVTGTDVDGPTVTGNDVDGANPLTHQEPPTVQMGESWAEIWQKGFLAG